MRTISETTTEPATTDPALPRFVQTVTAHCPYLVPALKQGLVTWLAYAVTQPWEAYGILAATIEAVRVRRRVQGELACANVVFTSPATREQAEALLVLPHWVAQHVYAPVQISLGAFLIGESGITRRSRFVAAPPVSFIVVRNCLPGPDRELMKSPGPGWPDMSHLISDSPDDGRDVVAELLGGTGADPRSVFLGLTRKFPPVFDHGWRAGDSDLEPCEGVNFP